MQFKHPELLWALLLLLIPIFIHLFQLRKFQKTPFTNVAFLKKVVSESRRSNRLKKWLLLLSRLLLLAGLVLAFAQPFFAKKNALLEKEMVIYLDNSFSMQAKEDGNIILNNAIQSLVKEIPKEEKFSLFTNTHAFRSVTLSEVQNDLLGIKEAAGQLKLEEVFLKSNTFFSDSEASVKNLVVVSDFQERFTENFQDSTSKFQSHFVQLQSDANENVSLDSVYLDTANENPELNVLLSQVGTLESLPVSLYNGEKLIAKSSAVFRENNKATVRFSLPKDEQIKGKVEVTDTGLAYDNQVYFSVNKKERINVLAIGDDNNFLRRIYTNDEFYFRSTDLKNLDYSIFSEQNLIILNELSSIPNAMLTSIKSFTNEGGKFVFIPAKEGQLNSYNSLSVNYFRTSFSRRIDKKLDITKINFSHPLFKNVFQKKVVNFQYPEVNSYFELNTNAPKLLSFQDGKPFLVGDGNAYFYSSAISTENSNYKNSPLIVPTFYNMGKSSLKLPSLYAIIGQNTTIDVATKLANDKILKAVNETNEFIPQQQVFSNRVSLNFAENLVDDGIYEIKDDTKRLQDISFNYDRQESILQYRKPRQENSEVNTNSIASLFDSIEKDSSITALWKWFVILAMLFLLVEILIQKYL